MTKIEKISAEEIFDSRGNPTLKVSVLAGGVEGSFSVPSGASTGAHEAIELRDGDAGYHNGKGVYKAIDSVNKVIAPELLEKDVFDQAGLDGIMIKLDGTENKGRLGANALIGVSVAAAKTAAKILGKETFEYLRTLKAIKPSRVAPYLYMNLINGGKHADNGLAFQEYHIVPVTSDVAEAVENGMKIQDALRQIILEKFGEGSTTLGDEGGFAPKISDIREPLQLLTEVIERNDLSGKVRLALDVAASSFYENGTYNVGGKKISKEELMSIYNSLIKEFNLISIEDPFDEEDFDSFRQQKESNDGLLVVGDDLTVTNPILLAKAMEKKSINAMIIKLNQIGTLSETLVTMRMARENGIELIVSHRSGETDDDFIADLAYAFGCFGLKAGAPEKAERRVKYERLKKISRLVSRSQIVATIGPVSRDKEVIKKLIEHQMDAARLNFSWGTYEEHAEAISNIRQASSEAGRKILIIQDLSGPRMKTEGGHEFNESADRVVTDKDIEDLKFGIGQGVDYVAMSFVGEKADVLTLRDEMKKAGKIIPIIAKIERKKALDNLDEIIEAADAIMVARGDLGNEIPLEEIPFAEKMIIEKCNKAGKPVITATQMLLTMTENVIPTRAEVTDVSYAITTGSDAVMLSEETASGKHPVLAVEMMERIVLEAEKKSPDRKINLL